jgi:hypothetical protein
VGVSVGASLGVSVGESVGVSVISILIPQCSNASVRLQNELNAPSRALHEASSVMELNVSTNHVKPVPPLPASVRVLSHPEGMRRQQEGVGPASNVL